MASKLVADESRFVRGAWLFAIGLIGILVIRWSLLDRARSVLKVLFDLSFVYPESSVVEIYVKLAFGLAFKVVEVLGAAFVIQSVNKDRFFRLIRNRSRFVCGLVVFAVAWNLAWVAGPPLSLLWYAFAFQLFLPDYLIRFILMYYFPLLAIDCAQLVLALVGLSLMLTAMNWGRIRDSLESL